MYLNRQITTRLLSLANSFPAIAVVGSRQVGKSTLLQHALPQADTVVFDPVLDIAGARSDPELFLANRGRPLILDEIQYAPELLPSLKRVIDRDRKPGQFFLTGSQQWGVMQSIAESLAGRIAFIDLDGFSLSELAQPQGPRPWILDWLDDPSTFLNSHRTRLKLPYTLHELLWRGSLPQAALLPADAVSTLHEAYQRTYIERDARQLADVSDWQLFGRFVRLTAALSAQQLNMAELGRDIGVTPQTSRRWLDVLKAIFQWHEVPAYDGNAIKRISSKPKGYCADTGAMCWALAISNPSAVPSHPNWGAIFETAVVCEIRKALHLSPAPAALYHWHAHAKTEVDLLIERNGTWFPIEVKAHSRPDRSATAGFAHFRRAYPHLRIAPGVVICPCEELTALATTDWAIPWDAAGSAQ
jgi:predicted AAA+ superfamily ATPase